MTTGQAITVREAARRVHRSEETIRRWIWSGRLPAAKHGNSYRIDIVYLDQLAEISGVGHAGSAASTDDLRVWLADLDQWKAHHSATAGSSAVALVIEDRHARR